MTNMDQYMKAVRRFPILSREEEQKTAIAYQNGDMSARQKLINSNLRFVMQRAHAYSGYINGRSITLPDLVQQGNVGLVRAVDKFDPKRGYRLITYAKWWIDAMIKSYVLYSFNIIKYGTTQEERKLFFKSGKIMEALWLADIEGKDKDEICKKLAEEYGVKLSAFLSFERRMHEFESSMDSPRGERDDDSLTLHNVVSCPPPQEESAEHKQFQTIIRESINSDLLTPRETEILRGHYLAVEHHTLARLGKRYNITRERVRQIRNKALRKIREHFDAQGITAQCVGIAA